MTLSDFLPSPAIGAYVRLFRIIDFDFGAGTLLPYKAYPPRPEDCLQFFPKGEEILKNAEAGLILNPKAVVVVGQQTKVIQRHLLTSRILTLQIVFQPGVLSWLTNISSSELRDQCFDATELFGYSIRLINEQLEAANGYHEMISVAERFILSIATKNKEHHNPLHHITKLMMNEQETYSVDKFSALAHLSHRQFDRRFREHAGLSPKTFLQLVRFDKAFRMKNRHPDYDWLKIAIHNGYHDYQHLAKDYRAFTGHTPVQFLALDNASPERAFGDAEI
ncbi:MAG: helix-turn-helix domain-containing protein [Flavitalea sp.]